MTSLAPLVLVDGSGYIFRAYHALPPLNRPDGTPVGAVYGFTSMMLRLLESEGKDGFAVIFDAGRKTFRNDIYADYKAHRPPTPEDLIPQFPLTRIVCEVFGVPCFESPGYEADDLIASYAKASIEAHRPVKIISGDKDLMQLIGPMLTLFDPLKNKSIGVQEVFEKFGVPPEKVIDVLSLMGDSSDNIPGVPGIGPKGAADLIQKFGDLENLLNHIKDVTKPSHQKSLLENVDKARLSKKLIQLKDDVPLPMPLESLHEHSMNPDKLFAFLKEQGFHSLLSRTERYIQKMSQSSLPIFSPSAEVENPPSKNYVLIQTESDLKDFLNTALKYPKIALDTETTSLDARSAELVGISLSYIPGHACYIPVGHKAQHSLLDANNAPKQLPLETVLFHLKPILNHPSILKIGHNIKYDLLVLKQHDVLVSPVDDTMVLSYVLDGTKTSHGLDTLALTYFNHVSLKFKDITTQGKSQITFDFVDLELACTYAAEDADFTLRLHDILKPRLLEERLSSVYETLERPLINVLTQMEYDGILVNPTTLRTLSQIFSERMYILEQEIHALAGRSFNIASPKQLGDVLYSDMGLETGKKGKSGDFSTRADILETFAAQGHVLPSRVLDWRGLAKLKNTYTETLVSQINSKTGRVHTSYSMTSTSTGRLSSSDPNLQNIPIRTEEGLKIRTAFIAPPRFSLVSLDYSQIELRLLAHVAHIPTLREAFLKNQDIHAITASHVFGVPIDRVDSTLRRKAKAINFGIIYGISPFGLSQQLGIPTKDAKTYIDSYFKTYPGIESYMEVTKTEARKNGYVETPFGRRCFITDINDRNPQRRAFAERQAINAPLQGGSADIIKKAMIRIFKNLKTDHSQTKMLLQVHDELVFEVREEDIDHVAPALKLEMETIVKLEVPLVVDIRVGKNWGEMTAFKKIKE